MPTDQQKNEFGGFFNELESHPKTTDRLSGIFDQFDAEKSAPEGLLKPKSKQALPTLKASKTKV